MGVPMGIPVFQIKDIIKDKGIITFSSNFTLYRDFSRRVFSVVQSEFPRFEQYSIDEAFVAIYGACDTDVVNQAIALKLRIWQLTGIPVSIGIGQTKTQAKFASTKAKRDPQGVFLTSAEWWDQTAHTVSIGDIWGVGRHLRERYHRYGIHTGADLRSAPLSVVQLIGGVVAVRLQHELLGRISYPITSTKPLPKSVISSRSFGVKTSDTGVIRSALTYHLHSIVQTLEEKGLVACTYFVQLEETWSAGRRRHVIPLVFPHPTRDISVLLAKLQSATAPLITGSVIYKKVGVSAQGLLPESSVQPTLFPTINAESDPALATPSVAHTLMVMLQAKYSDKVITIGTNTHQTDWRPRREQCSPSYTTLWSDICTVKALE
jgi:DNA polymerase V